jgi:hypothetical protein
MNWIVPKIWPDGDVWIFGGGPSVNKQFGIPDKVIQSVWNGSSPLSVTSPYFEALYEKHVIGVNIVFKIGDWFDIVFMGDNAFFLKYEEDLAVYPGLKVTCSSIQTSVAPEWMKFMEKDPEYMKGISPHPGKVAWNGNTGAAAISIAAHAGASRIILLGFDMKLGDTNRQHWHDAYKRGEFTSEERLKKLPFTRHLLGFEQIAIDAKRLGIEIINANPDSAIKEFPKCNVKYLL